MTADAPAAKNRMPPYAWPLAPFVYAWLFLTWLVVDAPRTLVGRQGRRLGDYLDERRGARLAELRRRELLRDWRDAARYGVTEAAIERFLRLRLGEDADELLRWWSSPTRSRDLPSLRDQQAAK